MSTAQEIELMAAAALPRFEAAARRFQQSMNDLAIYGMYVQIEREVCARRARKLRKRGESVRYVGRTTTGKARYSWLRRISPGALCVAINRPPVFELTRNVT